MAVNSDIALSDAFVDVSPWARETKGKINKWDCMKLKHFAQERKPSTRPRKQPTEWKKVFASNTFSKGFISKIHKEHM